MADEKKIKNVVHPDVPFFDIEFVMVKKVGERGRIFPLF